VISLYEVEDIISRDIFLSPKWNNVKTILQNDVERMQEYYLNLNTTVKNTHLLNRLILACNMNPDLDIIDYLNKAEGEALYTGKLFGVSSIDSIGRILDEELIYSGGTLLIHNMIDIDPFTIQDTWKTFEAIKPLRYDGLNLRPIHPLSVYEELNFSSFVIDIRLLLVQYKYWRTERINSGLEYNTGTFVYTFLFGVR